MKCPNCGASRTAEDRYCPYCLTKFDPFATVPEKKPEIHIHIHQEPQVRIEQSSLPEAQKSPKSRLIALLLCIFFGLFGVHRFYMGHKGLGFLYLFTYGLMGGGWVWDLIVLTIGSPKDKDGLYLSWI